MSRFSRPNPIDVTPEFVIAEWGTDSLRTIVGELDPTSGLFWVWGRLYRLILNVEVDEPVIYL